MGQTEGTDGLMALNLSLCHPVFHIVALRPLAFGHRSNAVPRLLCENRGRDSTFWPSPFGDWGLGPF